MSSDEFISRALPFLPEGQNSKEYFLKNITSPQFIDALNSLSSALSSENFQLLITSFGLSLNDTNGAYGVEGLINCLLKKYKKND